MEEDLRPRLSPLPPGERERRALRGFGIGLGIVLLVFAWRARGDAESSGMIAGLAAASVLLALARPSAFGPAYRLWMPVARFLARVNLRLVCGILYYLVVTPNGLLLRALGLRPLELKLRGKDSYWEEKPPSDPVESTRRIF